MNSTKRTREPSYPAILQSDWFSDPRRFFVADWVAAKHGISTRLALLAVDGCLAALIRVHMRKRQEWVPIREFEVASIDGACGAFHACGLADLEGEMIRLHGIEIDLERQKEYVNRASAANLKIAAKRAMDLANGNATASPQRRRSVAATSSLVSSLKSLVSEQESLGSVVSLGKGVQGEVAQAPRSPRGEPSKKSKRKISRPASWQPTQAHADQARELRVDLASELAKFCDHHDAKASRFGDWDAAFRNWLRRAAEFANSRTPNTRQPEVQAQYFAGSPDGPDFHRVARLLANEGE